LARTITRDEIPSTENLHLIEHDTYNALAAADLAVVASGTATLETAIIGTPLIVVYRASTLNWRIFAPLINVPHVGMPNLIAGRAIAPELLQDQLTGEALSRLIAELLADAPRLKTMREDLAAVRAQLGTAQASERAARCLLNLLA
jgi:lipid-A-disaccharide synthase